MNRKPIHVSYHINLENFNETQVDSTLIDIDLNDSMINLIKKLPYITNEHVLYRTSDTFEQKIAVDVDISISEFIIQYINPQFDKDDIDELYNVNLPLYNLNGNRSFFSIEEDYCDIKPAKRC